VVIAAPSPWGSPWQAGQQPDGSVLTAAQAVARFRRWISVNRVGAELFVRAQRELTGRDLACWCPLDQPCHGDVLLEIANGELHSRGCDAFPRGGDTP